MGKIQQRDEKSYENSIFLRYYRKVVVGTLKMISMRVRAVLRRLRSSFIIPLLTTTVRLPRTRIEMLLCLSFRPHDHLGSI